MSQQVRLSGEQPELACVVRLTAARGNRPPVVLLHGSANAAAVWSLWQPRLAAHGWSSYALDLRGHGRSPAVDLAQTGMADYASDVRTLFGQLRQPPVLVGWSMGGLLALMVAAAGEAAACVALAPSTPVRQVDAAVPVRCGIMTVEAYGITSTDPEEQPAMPDLTLDERRIALAALGPESLRARDERQRGMVIEALPCPLLLVTGALDRAWPRERYEDLWFPADRLHIEGASHWGLVLNERALQAMIPQVASWLDRVL